MPKVTASVSVLAAAAIGVLWRNDARVIRGETSTKAAAALGMLYNGVFRSEGAAANTRVSCFPHSMSIETVIAGGDLRSRHFQSGPLSHGFS